MTEYHYHNKQDRIIISIKTSVKSMVEKVKESFYSMGLIEAPEVHIVSVMPSRQLPSKVNR